MQDFSFIIFMIKMVCGLGNNGYLVQDINMYHGCSTLKYKYNKHEELNITSK